MIYAGAISYAKDMFSKLQRTEENTYYREMYASFVKAVGSAVVFDLGKYNAMTALASQEDRAFCEGNKVEAKVPYNTVWLEVDDEDIKTKLGILVVATPF